MTKYISLLFVTAQDLRDDPSAGQLFDDGELPKLFNYLMDAYSTIFPSQIDWEITDTTNAGTGDSVIHYGDYDLIVNYRLRYAGIQKRIEA